MFELKLQSAFAGRFGQGRHAAVILVLAAVEADCLMPACGRPLGDRLADGLGRRLVAAVLELRGADPCRAC